MKGKEFSQAILTTTRQNALAVNVPPAPYYAHMVRDLAKLMRAPSGLDLLKSLPKGMTLVPVFYSRVASEQVSRISREFSEHVRPLFMQFLAETREKDLRAMGVSERGIENMRHGREPFDEKGLRYSLSVDHVIERSGSGRWSYESALDPYSPDTQQRYKVNHFSNLIFLPESVHTLKNKLNTMQGTMALEPGQGKWILTLMRDKRDFLYRPHHSQISTFPLTRRKQSNDILPAGAPLVVDQASNALLYGTMKKKTVPPGLVAECAKTLRNAFNKAASSDRETDLKQFMGFYYGRRVALLRVRADYHHFAEVRSLRKTFNDIDSAIERCQLEKQEETITKKTPTLHERKFGSLLSLKAAK